jgi:hypothetical protein
VALFVVVGLWSFRALLFDGNFHTVIPNEVYRSAKPSPEALERRIKEFNLRSVIWLSTRKDKDPWVKAERSVTEVHGVNFYLVRLGNFIPPPATLQQLVYLFDTAKRPLLLHCAAGIERSGLASAVAVLLAGGDVPEARRQLGLTYGFAPLLCSPHFSKVFDDYEHWLTVQAWAHTPERFRHWVKNEYVPYFYRARLEPLDVPTSIIKGNKAIVRFHATNTSPQSWKFSSEGDGGIQPGAKVRSVEPGVWKQILLYGDFRDITVAPSKAIVLEVEIPPTLELGRYQFLVDLVNERARWFSDMGSEPLRFEIRVEKSKSLPGSWSPTNHALASYRWLNLRNDCNYRQRRQKQVGPGLVAINFGWGNPSDKKSSVNVPTSDEAWDPISGGYPNRLFQCEVKKLFGKKGKWSTLFFALIPSWLTDLSPTRKSSPISGLWILLPGKVEPHGQNPRHLTNAQAGQHPPLSSGQTDQKLAHYSTAKGRGFLLPG